MRNFLYISINELEYGCEICAFIHKIMRNFLFKCANCALRGPNIITGSTSNFQSVLKFHICGCDMAVNCFATGQVYFGLE